MSPRTTKNTYWRPTAGSAARATALLRLPAGLVAEITAVKPEEQSLASFLGDLIIHGLGQDPLRWRHIAPWEAQTQRTAAAVALIPTTADRPDEALGSDPEADIEW